MKKVLVVGGAGYIGGITVDKLITKGYEVGVYDKLLYEHRYLKDVKFYYGDIRNTKQLELIQQEYDEIIWLAAIVGDGACAQDPELTREINVLALDQFIKKTKRRVIFTSTCSVYGSQEGLLTEDSSTNPLSVYATTKLEAEKIVLDNNGLAFRLGTLFGLGDRFSRIRLDLVVNVLTLRAFRDKKLTVFGGDQWRPLLAVSEVAEYLVEAIEKTENDVYNIKFKNYKLLDLAKEIQKIFPETRLEITDMKFEDLRNYQVDSSKVDKVFSYRPHITIEQEVERILSLFKDHRIKDPNDSVYYNATYLKNLVNKADQEVYYGRS
jgi:nucleoside-diphosphate-sugar epimerase